VASVDDLYALAELWLEASVDALTYTDAGPPERAYVSPGQPPIDCEQLVVWCQTLGESPFQSGAGAEARSKAINRGGLAKLRLQIQVVRCVPNGTTTNGRFTPPTAADLAGSALLIDSDGWALWLGLNRHLKHAGGLLYEACSGAEREGWEKLVPQGGFGGWTGGYRVPVNGGTLAT
jgi:hypothetical protein